MLGDALVSYQTEWVLASSTVSVVLWQNVFLVPLLNIYVCLSAGYLVLSAPLVH